MADSYSARSGMSTEKYHDLLTTDELGHNYSSGELQSSLVRFAASEPEAEASGERRAFRERHSSDCESDFLKKHFQ